MPSLAADSRSTAQRDSANEIATSPACSGSVVEEAGAFSSSDKIAGAKSLDGDSDVKVTCEGSALPESARATTQGSANADDAAVYLAGLRLGVPLSPLTPANPAQDAEKERSEVPQRGTIFVAGFPLGFKGSLEVENALWHYFSRFSRPLSMRVVKEPHLKVIKHLFVDFESDAEALKVLDLIPTNPFRTYQLRAELARTGRTVTFFCRGPIDFPAIFDQAELTSVERGQLSDSDWPSGRPFNGWVVKKLASMFGKLEQVKEMHSHAEQRIYEVIFQRREDALRVSQAFSKIPNTSTFAVHFKALALSRVFGIVSDRGSCRPPPTIGKYHSFQRVGSPPHTTGLGPMHSTGVGRIGSKHGSSELDNSTHLRQATNESQDFTGVSDLFRVSPASIERSGCSADSSQTRLDQGTADGGDNVGATQDTEKSDPVDSETSPEAPSVITQREVISWADDTSDELERQHGRATQASSEPQDAAMTPSKDSAAAGAGGACDSSLSAQQRDKPRRNDRAGSLLQAVPTHEATPKAKAPLFNSSFDPFSIWVGSLPYYASEASLRAHFCQYGRVNDVQFRQTFAFVRFESQDSARAAIEQENKCSRRPDGLIVRPKEFRLAPKRLPGRSFSAYKQATASPIHERTHAAEGTKASPSPVESQASAAKSQAKEADGTRPLQNVPSVDYKLTLNRYVASQASTSRRTRLYRGPGQSANPTAMMRNGPSMRWPAAADSSTMQEGQAEVSGQQQDCSAAVGMSGGTATMPGMYGCPPMQMPYYYTSSASGPQLVALPPTWQSQATITTSQPFADPRSAQLGTSATPGFQPHEQSEVMTSLSSPKDPVQGSATRVDQAAAQPGTTGIAAPKGGAIASHPPLTSPAQARQPLNPAQTLSAERDTGNGGFRRANAPDNQRRGDPTRHTVPFPPRNGSQARGHHGHQSTPSQSSTASMAMPMVQHVMPWPPHPAGMPYQIPMWQAGPSHGHPPAIHYLPGAPPPTHHFQHGPGHEPIKGGPGQPPFGVFPGPPMPTHFAAMPYAPVYPMQWMGPAPFMGQGVQVPGPDVGQTGHVASPPLEAEGRERHDMPAEPMSASLEPSSADSGPLSSGESNGPNSPTPFELYGDYRSGPDGIEMMDVPSYAADY